MKLCRDHLRGLGWIIFILLFIFLTSPPSMAQTGESSGRNNALSEQYVSIDFNNVDINVFIKFISELTGKNFVIDQRVKGRVTIISPSKISVNEAYKVFESVLEVHGYTAVEADKVIKIVPAPDARSKNIETMLKDEAASPEDKVVTQIIPLNYADPNEIKKLFAPLISKSSVILSYPPTNTLIVTDMYSNIKRLLRILKTIDIPGIGMELSIVPLEHADAAKFLTILSSIFQKKPKAKAAAGETAKFVADERTNSIILLASKDDTERIKKLITLLDKQVPKGEEKIRVYYLENAKAEELAKVLQTIATKQATATTGKKTTPVVSAEVKITADKATNSLIIMAEKEDYVILEEIIKKLDIPRSMVYIEALIMEVNTTKSFNIGTEWQALGEAAFNEREGAVGVGFSPTGGFDPASLTSTPGFSLGIISGAITITTSLGDVVVPNIGAIVKAFQSDQDVHILSTPQILTTDNEEAKIVVGKNVPFRTRSTQISGTTDSYSSFEYKDVGKTLKITPQISQDRMVRLNISLEVSALAGDPEATDFRPTTLKRTVDTTVIVKDKYTVVIGGLIDDTVTITDTAVPCLGSAPGFGWLFRSASNADDRTNLYIFLTPYVVENPEESTEISETKKTEIDSIKEGNIKMYEKETE